MTLRKEPRAFKNSPRSITKNRNNGKKKENTTRSIQNETTKIYCKSQYHASKKIHVYDTDDEGRK